MAAQLIDCPESPSDSLECRVYERLNCGVPAACRPASALGDPEARWEADIRDISQAGARLVLKRRFEPGTGLAIEIPGDDESYTVLAKVVHVRREVDGLWSLGCKFISHLSESEKERLVNWTPPPDLAPKPIENVRFRLMVNQVALIDCRVRRFQQMESWPLPRGAVFELNGKSNTGRPWKFTVRTLHCVRNLSGWDLTCQLAKKVPAAKLLRVLGECLEGE